MGDSGGGGVSEPLVAADLPEKPFDCHHSHLTGLTR